MKVTRKIGKALAWFNFVYFGMNVIVSFFAVLASGNFGMLAVTVLAAAIPLNSYAALQLHRSIRNPEIKLSHQTPVGIRFVGAFVILIGLFVAGIGLLVILGAKEILQTWKENAVDMPQPFNIKSAGQLQGLGAIFAFLGLIITVGAVLNMRLLRWYYLVRQSDVF